ncbi:MAG: hypothetical protein WBH45_12685 [Acidobacteriaceae bacterium]
MHGDERTFEGQGLAGDRTDALIDAALRSYAEPGEIPAARVVAARVMERARAAKRRRRLWWWAVVVPATACLLAALAGTIWMVRGSRVAEIAWVPKAPGVTDSGKDIRTGAKAQVSSGTFTARLKSCPDTKPCRAESGSRRAENGPGMDRVFRTRLPKLKVFPTPRPLSPEEQALMAFTEQAKPEVTKQVVEAEKHLGDPISIAELKIAPLESGGKQNSNKER